MLKTYLELQQMHFTDEQIKDLKAKHGDDLSLVKFSVDNGEVASFIIKTPSRKTLDLVAHHGVKKDVLASNKTLISNCVVDGDMEVMERDGGIYSQLLVEIQNQLTKKEVAVKKL